MPRISDIEMLSLPEMPILRIRKTANVSELPSIIAGGYAAIGAYLREADSLPADVPFVAFAGENPEKLQLEICFPLPEPLPENPGAEIEAAVIPAGKAASCMYLGAFAGTMEVYEEMHAWLEKNGYPRPATSREYYYNGQEYPEEQYLTRIVMPL